MWVREWWAAEWAWMSERWAKLSVNKHEWTSGESSYRWVGTDEHEWAAVQNADFWVWQWISYKATMNYFVSTQAVLSRLYQRLYWDTFAFTQETLPIFKCNKVKWFTCILQCVTLCCTDINETVQTPTGIQIPFIKDSASHVSIYCMANSMSEEHTVFSFCISFHFRQMVTSQQAHLAMASETDTGRRALLCRHLSLRRVYCI